MRRTRLYLAGLTAIAGSAIAVAPASANHQPGEIETKVFKTTIDASGGFTGTGASQAGGTWNMAASPFWKVVYPDLAVPISGDQELRPSPNYSSSSQFAGTITWSGTTQYDFTTPPPEPFTCSEQLAGPPLAGPPQGFVNRVVGQGADIEFELSALNQFGIVGNGSCAPPQSTGFAGWTVSLGNHTQVLTTISRQELFEQDTVQKSIEDGSGNAPPACTFGCITASMSWSGSLTLEKNCRNYAGTATNFTGGGQTVTNPFCESACSPSNCAQADLDLIPLASPAKENGGEVEFAVSCYGEQTCTGKQLLAAAGNARRAGSKLGSGDFAVQPASHTETQIKLSRAGRRDLKQDGKIKATLKSTLEGEEVADATDSLKVTIKKG